MATPKLTDAMVVPRWVMTIVGPVIIAAILGLFTFVLNVGTRLAVMETQEIPPPEVRFRLMEHERRLEALERGNEP